MIVVPPETTRDDDRVSDISTDRPLSVESALSVREAAIAIRYHAVQYLPVVDAGRLVGIVAFREEPRRRREPDLGSDRHAGGSAAGTSGATTVTSSSEEDR